MKNNTLWSFAVLALITFSLAPLAYAREGSDDASAVASTGERVETRMDSGDMMKNKSDDGMMDDDMMGGDDDSDKRGMEQAEMMADDHAMFGLETAKMHINVHALMKEEGEPGHGGGESEIDHPGKVHSAADFEHFVAHKAKTDKDISAVDVKNGKVKVGYRMPAKFLGFMNSSVTARAEVDGAGNVEVSYPWYHIFMKKHVSSASLQSEIARALAAKRKAEKEGVATTTIEADVEAAFDAPNLFEMLADILKGASAKAKAEAEASVQ